MPIIRPTRGAFYKVVGRSQKEIPDTISIAWRFVRENKNEDTPFLAPGKKAVFGEIVTADLDIVQTLFELTVFSAPGGGVIGDEWDLIVKYLNRERNRTTTFKNVVTGIGPGDRVSTFKPLVDKGEIQPHRISFQLIMDTVLPIGDAVTTVNG